MNDPRGPTYFVSERVLRRGAEEPLGLLVEGGVVTKIVSAEEARRSGVSREDFGSSPLVPGFVNGHCHLAMAPLRGISDEVARRGNLVEDVFFRLERHLSAVDVRVFSRLGAFECLLGGITEVFDHYYFGTEVAEALAEVGLAGTVAPTLQDVAGPFASATERAFDETMSIHCSARLRSRGVFAALGPHASDTVSDELFGRIASVAEKEGLPVHLHLAQSYAEFERGRGLIVERALPNLGAAKLLFAHGLFLDESDLDALASKDAVLAYCPLSQLQFGFLGPVSRYLERGGAVTLGTDCVASNDAHNVQRELSWISGARNLEISFGAERLRFFDGKRLERAKSLDEKRSDAAGFPGGTPEVLLDVAFGVGLEKFDSRVRGIELGAAANFQILDERAPELYPRGNIARRLAYGDTKSAIRSLVVRGDVLFERGAFRESILESDLYRETLSEAERRRDELFSRAGL